MANWVFSLWQDLGREFHLRLLRWRFGPLMQNHPFNVWMLIPKGTLEAAEKNPEAGLDLLQAEFQLVPDQLANYDFGYGLMFLFGLWWLGDCAFWGVISFVAVWLVIPPLVHVVLLRPRIYTGLNPHVPPGLQEWVLALPSHTIEVPARAFQTVRTRDKMRHLLCHMIRDRLRPKGMLRSSRDPIYFQASSSPQAAFLALGLAAHFAPRRDESDGLMGRGFLHFFFHYCAPVWLSYIWLILTLLVTGSTPPAQLTLVILWAFISMLFIYRVVISYGNWLDRRTAADVSLRSLSYAPIWQAGAYPPTDLRVVRDRRVRSIVSAVTSLALAVALATLQVLEDPLAADRNSLTYGLRCLVCRERPAMSGPAPTPKPVALKTVNQHGKG